MAKSHDRRCRVITFEGKAQILRDWARERNISPTALGQRLSSGWSLERALTTPCRAGYSEGLQRQRAASRAWWRANGKQWREGRVAANAWDVGDGW